MGAAMLAVAIATLLGTFLGQLTLNEHARHLAWATNDASRVMEQLRLRNTNPCVADPNPSAAVPAATGVGTCTAPIVSWDDWLQRCGEGKSIQPNPAVNELVVVTSSGADPLTVTVAVCWRHRGRTLGECTWNGALAANPGAGGDVQVTESPAMLTTFMTCRR